jgi:hypothetical protein
MAKKSGSRKPLSSAAIRARASLPLSGDFFAEWWPFQFSRDCYDLMSRYEKAQFRALFCRLVKAATNERIRNTRPSYLRLVAATT